MASRWWLEFSQVIVVPRTVNVFSEECKDIPSQMRGHTHEVFLWKREQSSTHPFHHQRPETWMKLWVRSKIFFRKKATLTFCRWARSPSLPYRHLWCHGLLAHVFAALNLTSTTWMSCRLDSVSAWTAWSNYLWRKTSWAHCPNRLAPWRVWKPWTWTTTGLLIFQRVCSPWVVWNYYGWVEMLWRIFAGNGVILPTWKSYAVMTTSWRNCQMNYAVCRVYSPWMLPRIRSGLCRRVLVASLVWKCSLPTAVLWKNFPIPFPCCRTCPNWTWAAMHWLAFQTSWPVQGEWSRSIWVITCWHAFQRGWQIWSRWKSWTLATINWTALHLLKGLGGHALVLLNLSFMVIVSTACRTHSVTWTNFRFYAWVWIVAMSPYIQETPSRAYQRVLAS